MTNTSHADDIESVPTTTQITVEGNRTIVHSVAPGETVVIEAHADIVGPDNDDNDSL